MGLGVLETQRDEKCEGGEAGEGRCAGVHGCQLERNRGKAGQTDRWDEEWVGGRERQAEELG